MEILDYITFFGDAVFVIFSCGVAVLTVPQCPPKKIQKGLEVEGPETY